MPGFTMSHWWQVQVRMAWAGPGCWCSQLSARLPCVGGCSFSEPAACLQHRGARGQEEAVSSSSLFSSTPVSGPGAKQGSCPSTWGAAGCQRRYRKYPQPELWALFFGSYKPPLQRSTWVQEKIYLLWNCTPWFTSMTFSISILDMSLMGI